jgi:hypothetical protein
MKTTKERTMSDALKGDIRNPIVKWAVQINDLENQLAYAREQYKHACERMTV